MNHKFVYLLLINLIICLFLLLVTICIGAEGSPEASNGTLGTEPVAEGPGTSHILSNVTSGGTVKQDAKKNAADYLTNEALVELRELCPMLKNLTKFPDPRARRYRYYEPTGKCYEYGYGGPCNAGMAMYIKEEGSIYGECECKITARLHVYHEDTNSCYKIFSKGWCSEGYHVDLSQEGKPICSEDPCADKGEDFVLLNGTCTKIGRPNDEICPPGKHFTVDFVKNRRLPICTHPIRAATAIGLAPCPPGTYKAIHGKCHTTEFEFGFEQESPRPTRQTSTSSSS